MPLIKNLTIIIVCCLLFGCATPQKTEEESKESGDSTAMASPADGQAGVNSVSTAAVTEVATAATGTDPNADFPLDELKQYVNPEALVEKFGATNVVRDVIPVPGFTGTPVVYLFRGSDRELKFEFDATGESFEKVTAGEGTRWYLNNGLRVGMTMQEVQDLEGAVLAFNIWGTAYPYEKLRDPFSGFAMSLPASLQGSKDSSIFWKSDQYKDEDIRVVKLMCFYYDQFEGD